MVRYEGQPLPPSPRIALIANDAIGNFVVTTPLAQLLRAELSPSVVDYFGGTRTIELQEASDLYDSTFPLHGTTPAESFRTCSDREYDLVVNVEATALASAFAGFLSGPSTLVCGPCLGARGPVPYPADSRGDLWRDQEWIAGDLNLRYPFLRSGFIGEILCRLAYREGRLPSYRLPTLAPPIGLPPVLIACSASLPEKIWPAEKWSAVSRWLTDRGMEIGLIGAKPSAQKAFWLGSDAEDAVIASGVKDLRGTMSLPQVVGALSHAKLVLTLDNGILHLAAASQTSTVGLFRHGIHRLWAPPFASLTILTPGSESTPVAEIPLQSVQEAIESAL